MAQGLNSDYREVPEGVDLQLSETLNHVFRHEVWACGVGRLIGEEMVFKLFDPIEAQIGIDGFQASDDNVHEIIKSIRKFVHGKIPFTDYTEKQPIWAIKGKGFVSVSCMGTFENRRKTND